PPVEAEVDRWFACSHALLSESGRASIHQAFQSAPFQRSLTCGAVKRSRGQLALFSPRGRGYRTHFQAAMPAVVGGNHGPCLEPRSLVVGTLSSARRVEVPPPFIGTR